MSGGRILVSENFPLPIFQLETVRGDFSMYKIWKYNFGYRKYLVIIWVSFFGHGGKWPFLAHPSARRSFSFLGHKNHINPLEKW